MVSEDWPRTGCAKAPPCGRAMTLVALRLSRGGGRPECEPKQRRSAHHQQPETVARVGSKATGIPAAWHCAPSIDRPFPLSRRRTSAEAHHRMKRSCFFVNTVASHTAMVKDFTAPVPTESDGHLKPQAAKESRLIAAVRRLGRTVPSPAPQTDCRRRIRRSPAFSFSQFECRRLSNRNTHDRTFHPSCADLQVCGACWCVVGYLEVDAECLHTAGHSNLIDRSRGFTHYGVHTITGHFSRAPKQCWTHLTGFRNNSRYLIPASSIRLRATARSTCHLDGTGFSGYDTISEMPTWIISTVQRVHGGPPFLETGKSYTRHKV